MESLKNNKLKVLLLSTAIWATACSEVAFSPDPNFVQDLEVPDGYMLETFGFSEQDTRAKVDILFIVDNSGSMSDEQVKLAPALSSFISSLARIDWQIGISTTDVSDGTYGLKGSLVPFSGTSTKILNKNVPNYAAAFANTVVRPEVTCTPSGPSCPSSDERPLQAITMAIGKRNAENNGFFRNGADLATVILSDEDEGSTGAGTTGQMVVDSVKAAFGSKTYTGFGIVIKPGDTACFNAQTASSGKYATFAGGLATLTGGLLGSICDSDYGPTLTSIGQRVREMVKTITLRMMPNPDTIQIRIRPFDPNLQWTIEGQTITFNTPPKPGTRIDIMYLPF